MLTPRARKLRARKAAFTLHAKHDPRKTTAAARAAFMETFRTTVDPNGELPEAERERRAKAAYNAYFADMAYKRELKRNRTRVRTAKAAKRAPSPPAEDVWPPAPAADEAA
jgi:hypothetical protein